MDIKQKGTNADKSRYRNRVRDSVEGDHDSGGKPITHSGAKPISDSGLKAIGNRSPAEWWAALFRDLALARADGSFRSVLARLSRTDVLVIDDWAMAPLSEPERRDFREICEDRYQVRSLILTSQLPVTRWHEQIGDPTVADGILDRLVPKAHRIEMRGDSMRKNRGKPNT